MVCAAALYSKKNSTACGRKARKLLGGDEVLNLACSIPVELCIEEIFAKICVMPSQGEQQKLHI